MLTYSFGRSFTYDGTLEYPRRFTPLHEHEGITLEAGDGTPTLVQLSSKRRWRIEWESPRPEIVQRWRVYNLTKIPRVLIDFYGDGYTVVIPIGSFTYTGEFLPSGGITGATAPMSVELWEI
jgi:hypothetical protein